MKEPSYLIRKKVYDALDGNITLNSATLSVYNVVPSSGSYPYIYIYSISNDNTESNKSKYISSIITRVEVITAFDTNTGGQLDCNLAMNQITQLLVSQSSYFDLSSDNFNVYGARNNGITYITEDTDTQTLYRAILSFESTVEQTS
jgi:hypothetical protein